MIDLTALPDNLKPFVDKITATAKPTIEMQLTPVEQPILWESRIGGMPYLPLGSDFPVDSDGIPLKLLAQINFAQMPPLENYPTTGLLQFFIGGDDLYGADFDDLQTQNGFRVIYWDSVIEDNAKLQQDFSAIEVAYEDEYYSPIEGQFSLEFTPATQYISSNDFQFGRKILDVDDLYDYEDQFEGEDFYDEWLEPYNEHFASNGHRIGGYPFFTQTDPREYRKEIQDYVLLLQIDSDYETGILWGDIGVGNFFIHPEDLKNKDFSKVVYNWDCG
ncbi:DUF1963 domain-containing protein [Providencia stuartii]